MYMYMHMYVYNPLLARVHSVTEKILVLTDLKTKKLSETTITAIPGYKLNLLHVSFK